MKKSIFFLFIFFAMCFSAFSQSSFPEFDKAKEIRLLESAPADVESILSDFKSDFAENSAYFRFVTKNAIIEIHYSSGYRNIYYSEKKIKISKFRN